MTLLEVLITIAILGVLALLAAPSAAKLIRRSQDLAAYSSMRQVLASARLQAVKRGANVVVLVNLTPENKIHLHTFQDRANDETNPLPGDEQGAAANFQQDIGTFLTSPATDEPTLGDVVLPSNVVVRKQDGTSGIAFDEYAGNATLTDRIVFLPTGGIAPPEDSDSRPPDTSGGRGIYFADAAGKNYFRVTVDSNVSGRLRVDKYMPTTTARYPTAGYRPTEWQWY
jgi:prepilin-type N-terminal cleavage/methylation domain-containing protein